MQPALIDWLSLFLPLGR